MRRTSGHARGPVFFVDDEGLGDSLREESICGFSIAQVLVELVRHRDGAHTGANRRRPTPIFADVAGLLTNSDLKSAFFALDLINFTIGE